MYSSFCQSKHLTYIPFLAIQLFLIRRVSSLNLTNAYLHHNCLASEGKYLPRSDYEENLNTFIRFESSARYTDGYSQTTYGGESNNYVTGIFQCRGDSYKTNCRSCFATAIAGLQRRCPKNKGAIIWYDQCFLHISSVISIEKSLDLEKIDYENTFSMNNPNNITGDVNLFNKKTRDLFNKLILIAVNKRNGTKRVYYAIGEERLGTKKVYAMVQCTRLMVSCEKCLKWSINELFKCCNGRQGARVLVGTTCSLRYELYPFLRT
ncbi:hypothetical protein AALP_AA4G007200 [Arabis alpina]|uniref:Gnk2-homologous domain-containing protein n=1 Tax=Arabis alpina TaxID=50452 RepID=A0A087H0B2_ARAAL|nr:hypothetical protein AALP_AA4G007200 [Arabis alpina]